MTSPDPTAAGIAVSVARRVRVLREERRWSAEYLAERLTDAGVRTVRSSVANLENGRRRDITVAEVLSYAQVFCVPPALVLGEPLDELQMAAPDSESDVRISVAALVDWFAGVELPPALNEGPAGHDFDKAARPLAAHRRHAALLDRLIYDYVRRGEQNPPLPDDEHVQELARHRIHMRDMGAALDKLSLWAPPEVNELLADPVLDAEKQLGAEYERTSSPTLESTR